MWSSTCVPVSMWQCHCLIFCKVTHLRMFKEQKCIIRFGLNQASDTGRMGGREGGQRWSGTYNSISYLLYVLDKLPLFSLSVTISWSAKWAQYFKITMLVKTLCKLQVSAAVRDYQPWPSPNVAQCFMWWPAKTYYGLIPHPSSAKGQGEGRWGRYVES